MSDSLQRLLELLDLERIEVNLFRGRNPEGSRLRLFGGQVLAQGLVAALRTVEGRLAHSLHAYFLRPGDPHVPTVFEVERVRDGGTFATRLVKAIQHGEAILNMSVSFQVETTGLEHQIDKPAEPSEPGGVLYEEEMRSGVEAMGFAPPEGDLLFHPPVEIRTVGGLRMFEATSRPPAHEQLGPCQGPAPRRSRDPPVRARLRVRHDLAVERGERAPDRGRVAALPVGVARPRDVVPPSVPHRRLAALRDGEPGERALAWLLPRDVLHPRRQAGRVLRARGADPGSRETLTQHPPCPSEPSAEHVRQAIRSLQANDSSTDFRIATLASPDAVRDKPWVNEVRESQHRRHRQSP